MSKIYIGNLSFRADPSDLIEELENKFSQFGEIDDISVIEDRQTGRIKGFGFITFASDEAAEKALGLNGEDLMGRPMRVSTAKESQKND